MRRACPLLIALAGCTTTVADDVLPPDDGGAAADLATPAPGDGAAALDLAAPPPPGYTASLLLHVEPDDGIAPVSAAIDGAGKSLDVTVYLLSDNTVVNKLIAAKKRGVAVRVILEQSPMADSNATVFQQLQSAGVPVAWGNPAFTYTHEKAIIVDGKALWAMTGNLSAAAFSANREYIAVDSDPADVAEAEAVFAADWARTAATAARLAVAPENGRARIDFVLQGATKELDVEWEELSDNDIASRLQAAAKAGHAVKVIAPSGPAPATMNMLSALKAGGVQVRLATKLYMHAKMVLADRARGFIGSENATLSSLGGNRELGVVWQNAQVAQRLAATFDADWAAATPL